MRPAAGIVLAGGTGRRLGGLDKPALEVGGLSLLDRALAALAGVPVVVVGPERVTDEVVTFVREEPPGGGPAAAVAAGLAALPELGSDALVAVLAADLPAVTAGTLQRLAAAVSDTDGALLVDAGGREQLLLGVWRSDSLTRVRAARPDWTGASLRDLLAPLTRIGVAAAGDEAADIDTPAELARWRR